MISTFLIKFNFISRGNKRLQNSSRCKLLSPSVTSNSTSSPVDVRYSLSGGAGASVDLTAAADVITADGSVVPLSASFLVVSTACVVWLGLLCAKLEVVCSLGTVVTSRAPVLVRRVVGFVVASVPAVDSWRRLDGVVGCVATDDRGAQSEAVEGGAVCSAVVVVVVVVASVGDGEAAVLAVLLRIEGEVAAGGGVAGAVVVGAAVLAGVEAPTVSSSVT